jgi:hypothetical protein
MVRREAFPALRFILGFRVRACHSYCAKMQGQSETPHQLRAPSCSYCREFLNDADLNAQVLSCATQAENILIHRTTGECRMVRFERDERLRQKPLTLQRYRPMGPAADIGTSAALARRT